MELIRNIFVLLTIILLIPFVSGAIIHGKVYDITLDSVDNVKVTINTLPSQTFVVKNGSYRFEVVPGSYVLQADEFRLGELYSSVVENLTIENDGIYVIDLILYPEYSEEVSFDEDISSIDITNENNIIEKPQKNNFWDFLIIILVILFLILLLIYIKGKKQPKKRKVITKESDNKQLKGLDNPLDDYCMLILAILEENNGRISQRDLRKKLPQSEAKVSLMIADLAERGLVKKIKQGRGNILCLRRKG